MRSVSDTTQESRGGGTALYMAPEQGRGAEPLPAQDVYSLGVIWYQLLTEDFGRAPGPTWRKAMSGRGVPEAHLGLLEACLDDDPRERPADGTALLAGIAGLSAEAQERRRQQALQTTREQEARQREAAEAEDRDREAQERQERWHRYASARLWSACAWAAVCGLGGGLVGGILGHIGCVPFATALGGGLAGGIILPLLLFALAMASYSASGDTSTDDGALAGAAIWGVILGAVTGLILGFATIARDAKAWESSRFLAAGIIGGCLIGIAAGVYEGLRRANKSRPEGF